MMRVALVLVLSRLTVSLVPRRCAGLAVRAKHDHARRRAALDAKPKAPKKKTAEADEDSMLLESLLGELSDFDDKAADEEEEEDAGGDDDVVEEPVDDDDDDDDAFLMALAGDEDFDLDAVDETKTAAAVPKAEEDEEEEEEEEVEATSDSLTELLKMGQVDDDLMDEEEWLMAKDEYDESETRRAALREKRRLANEEEARLAAERGIGLLQRDPLCRGIVVCITTGSAADNATVDALRTLLKDEFGAAIEIAHNCDPDPDPDAFPFFEVWLEGYRYMVLHARNANGDGDLLPERMREIVDIVRVEISDEARDILGTYVGFEGDD